MAKTSSSITPSPLLQKTGILVSSALMMLVSISILAFLADSLLRNLG